MNEKIFKINSKSSHVFLVLLGADSEGFCERDGYNIGRNEGEE